MPTKRRALRAGPADRDGAIRARNRAIILKAARQIFAARGFDGTRIAGIAAACGLPKANIYYYFESKERIYRAVIDELLAEWNRAFEHITLDRDPAEAIAAYVRAKLAYSRDNPASSKIFANENVRGARFLSRRDNQNIRRITRQKARVVEAWIAAGKMRPVDPIHFFILLWSATQFYADFDAQARNALGVRRLTWGDFARAAETIVGILAAGCGFRVRRPADRRRHHEPLVERDGV